MMMTSIVHQSPGGTTSLNGKPVSGGNHKPAPALSPVPNGHLRVPSGRRSSLTISRRTLSLEAVPEDPESQRWSDTIRSDRSRRVSSRRTGGNITPIGGITTEDEDRVLVGTKVAEGHANYETAYNMLTGIRFTVSRTQAKLDRPLNIEDFDTKHKFSFDVGGGELTPATKYDFKFKDYAPWVFRELRNKFHIHPADYIMSLTSKFVLTELSSPGKSKSFFYFSRDFKYIIKTIHHHEHKFLRKILKDYYKHVEENPNTLISQFYGLHRVKMPFGRKIHFVVMNNLMPPHKDVHSVYDLKGSTLGREYPEDKLAEKLKNEQFHPTLKDLNWLNRGLNIELGHNEKERFVEQLEKDTKFLKKLKVMDYSLFVATHDLNRGNKDRLRDKTLQVFQPNPEDNGPQPGVLARTPSKLEHARRVRDLRESVKKERPVPMQSATDIMPDEADRTGEFYTDDGGIRATNSDGTPSSTVYYLGIIDCLTRYNTVKKLEHLWKGFTAGKEEPKISPLPPQRYGDRFVNFIKRITKGADVAEKQRASDSARNSAGSQRQSGGQQRPSRESPRTSGEGNREKPMMRTMRSS
ncbi:Phosphatidylinositol-4-phosphate 5-kinase [Saxophila tyrrhenica]|uniref:1-phosphatidylinositol-4-phosphate 5-kinase n=1 Tax=Saxophila tyrrhenica TaxID=1690608 RepID=A0AAV9PJP7_9PEZI|nr:Phosphatidylinositol-4-phosphate 5-kinase [Saxophila tyrrhenica]